MKRIHKTALVPYTVHDMFNLVNDIMEYPKFLPWCHSVHLLSQTDTGVMATITMGSAGLGKSFTTKNFVKEGESIEMSLVDGPFSHLEGRWKFQPLGKEGCKISLDMEFEITNKLLRVSLEPIFVKIANTLVDSFIKRAHEIYARA